MPRKKKWPPTVFRHQSGQDRVRIDGKDFYLGKSGSDEARAAYARLIAEVAAGRPVISEAKAGPALSVRDVVAEWWGPAGPGAKYSERGREAVQFRRALQPLLRLYGPTRADAFKADQLEALRGAMASGSWMTAQEREQSRQPCWCANRCNRMCGRIKTLWRWAERKGYVPDGRWAHLCALPGLGRNDASVRHTAARKACSWDELSLVLPHCVRPVRAILLLLWHTGMRPGDACLMRACDVERSGEVWVYRPATHKNDWRGQDRAVPLGPAAQKVLAPFLLETEGEAYVFVPVQRRAKDHYGCDTFSQSVRRAALEAGVPDLHAYKIRHAYKARVTREMGMDAARAAMGQKSISSTNLYSSATDLKAASEVAKRLG